MRIAQLRGLVKLKSKNLRKTWKWLNVSSQNSFFIFIYFLLFFFISHFLFCLFAGIISQHIIFLAVQPFSCMDGLVLSMTRFGWRFSIGIIALALFPLHI